MSPDGTTQKSKASEKRPFLNRFRDFIVMMGEFLFKIRETFQLENIGLSVAVDIKFKDARLKIHDEIELLPLEGSPLVTAVAGIPMFNPYNPERTFSFLLPKGLNKRERVKSTRHANISIRAPNTLRR